MLDSSATTQADTYSSQNGGNSHVFRMIRSDRTAGAIPFWEKGAPKVQDLELVEGESSVFAVGNSFRDTLEEVRKEPQNASLNTEEEPFGFFDLLDMVNPLQHIPILSFFYRAITGDEIKPISQIIGGGVFGGPLGAASGLVSAVIEDGTGKEPLGLALSLVDGRDEEDAPSLRYKGEAGLAAHQYAKAQGEPSRSSHFLNLNA
jgi:hypothetical protein